MNEEEVKRQLERLTREQKELRQQAEELAKTDSAGQLAAGQQASRPTGQQANRVSQGAKARQVQGREQKLREISEEMRNAAGDLRRQDPQQASARGAKAGEELRGLEQQMQGARPDERRRAMGDLQLETRQLADAERRLGNEASRTARGQPETMRAAGWPASRSGSRIAPSGWRVGEAAGRRRGEGDEKQATTDAARELERQKVAERMRQSAEAMRQGSRPAASREPAAGSRARSRARSTRSPIDSAPPALAMPKPRCRISCPGAGTARSAQPTAAVDGGAKGTGCDRVQGAQGAQGHKVRTGCRRARKGRPASKGRQPAAATASQLQREVNEPDARGAELADEMRRENPGMQKGARRRSSGGGASRRPAPRRSSRTSRGGSRSRRICWSRSTRPSRSVRPTARARERERLNAGGHEAVSDAYGAGRSLLSVACRPRRSQNRLNGFAVALPWWGYALAFGAALVLGWLAYARVPVS